MMSSHEQRVRAVAEGLAARPPGATITIRKSSPSHSIRDSGYKARCHPVDVSSLNNILHIDPDKRVARVEGQVFISDLAQAALAHGLLPAVVPELRKFTIAGLINGEGIQSSSHRYGAFTHTLESVELLLANGSIVEASRDQHAELFAVLPESLGTLGIVTAATIRLVPAKPYVRASYQRFTSIDEYIAAFRGSLETCDFHEGVIFGPEWYVLITADFADQPRDAVLLHPERTGELYFFQHVRAATAAHPSSTHVMETLPYLSRSERGMWWMVECYADFPLLSETAWGRRRLDAALTEAYDSIGLGSQQMTATERDRCLITQDMGVTLDRMREGIVWVQERLGVDPLWNCALLVPEALRPTYGATYLVDIGIYGEPDRADYRHVRDMRALQTMANMPSLWGMSYLSWDELGATNPARFERYERVRRDYQAGDAFLHISEKVVWVDPATPDQGKIPFWRLYRTFGARWFLNPVVYLLLPIVLLSKLVFRRPSLAR